MEPIKLTPDIDWVDDQEPGTLVRFGFIGKSGRAGRWRLYTHPDLTDYLEFFESEVLKVTPVSTAQSPLGGSIVWFKVDGKLQRFSSRSHEEQSGFLKGPVTAGFLRSAGRVNIGDGFVTETVIDHAVSFWAACPSHWLGCTAACTAHCGFTFVGGCPIYSLACTYEKTLCG